MASSEPIVYSGAGVTVQKAYHESVYPSPAIVFAIEHWGEEPRTLTLTESLPDGVDGTLIEFEGDGWDARSEELVFSTTLQGEAHVETAYSYAGDFEESLDAWLSEPHVTVAVDDGEPTVLTVDDPGETPVAATVGIAAESPLTAGSDGAGAEASSETRVYGDGIAYEPDEPEEVESGDVYGQQDATPFEDHEAVEPDGLYTEIEDRWAAEDVDPEPHTYGEQDAYEPDDAGNGHRYGDSDPIPDDE
ncbi:hypothetical protein EGH24_04500 [Halonotius terrestris]|uniref:Uncharacterized protein n=1 Tax=Halonotius terrestris TaxID=2487750 RepID=A0A8J8TC16_9EURY|nr:hypothetical protein [Halonotius terrestris]TQQ82712.1 hypothetical protein EGH24_04500 [Halonotius terrestris]